MERLFFFTEKSTPRLNYVLNWLFKDHYPVELAVVNDLNSVPIGSPVVNYSHFVTKNHSKSLHIVPCGLLFESGIDMEMCHQKALEKLKTAGSSSFDVFSALFYVLSRYEEYVVIERDQYGRFSFRHATRFGDYSWLSPICDIWAAELVAEINRFLGLNLTHQKQYRFKPTFDIDIAFAYKFKGFVRTVASLGKKFIKADYIGLFKHFGFLFLGGNDPFDTYDLICEKSAGLKPIYFIHFGDYGKEDVSLNWNNPKLREAFLSKLKGDFQVGIHPSLLSNRNTKKLEEEALRFEALFGQKPTLSRQHYLVLNLPETYRRLMALGIKEDYSLGYAETIGFRAGTCSPFHWFDLMEERATDLLLYPQTYMDRTVFDYMKLSEADAEKATKQHIDLIKKHLGTFSPIWHNSTINESKKFHKLFHLMFEHGT